MLFSIMNVLLFCSVIIVFAQDQASAPSFKEGDTWQFNIARQGGVVSSTESNDGIYELTFAQGKLKLFEVSGNQKTEIEPNPDGPTQGLLTLVGKSEQRPDLKFPLSEGQKWSYEYQTRPAGLRQDQKRSVEINVAGIEKVTTPAGAFDAYKLIKSESWSTGKGAGRGGNSVTYFFSPETRSIVKRSSRSEGSGANIETELIKFTPGT
jgi:hypothetical protein